MQKIEILSLIITLVCLVSFSIVFTYLFRNYFLNTIKDINDGREDIDIMDAFLEEEKAKKNKRKKALKLAGRITSYTFLGIVLVFFSFSLTSRILDNSLLFNDSGIVVIASGSMSQKNEKNDYLVTNNLNNQFDTYDIIGLTKYKNKEEVKLYDVIAFKDDNGNTIVHRIISLENSNGNLSINTKGDSNDNSDLGSLYKENLKFEDIIGKYNEFKIPLLGSFVIFLQSNSGIITIISIAYCFVMFDYYSNKLNKAILERTNLLIELIDYDVDQPEVKNYFKQELIYKGYKYFFEKGEFIKKEEIQDEEVKNDSLQNMYSKVELDENNPEDSKILVKNVSSDQIVKINDEENKNISFIDTVKSFLKKNKKNDNA